MLDDSKSFFERTSFNLVSRFIGAAARAFLFIVGIIAILFVVVFGALGYLIWIILPFVSYPTYISYKNSPKSVARAKVERILRNQGAAVRILFDGKPGEFVLSHLGKTAEEFTGGAQKRVVIEKQPDNFADLMQTFVEGGVWSEDFFRKQGIAPQDLTMAALWWDKIASKDNLFSEKRTFAKPGIGLELTYGYTPTLDKYSIDMGVTQDFTHRLIGRKKVVGQIERALLAGSNVVLVGRPGVGKKTIVLEFARRAVEGVLDKRLSYHRILELDYNFLLSESLDLNQKKNSFMQILQETQAAGNIILMMRDIHRITNFEVEGVDFTDVLESALEKRKLKIIAVSTPSDYARFMARNMRLRKYFEPVDAAQPTLEEALEILTEAAGNWESHGKSPFLVQSLRKIVASSDQYITDIPFPEKALELLEATITYKEQEGQSGAVTVEDVNVVLSEKTGISFTSLTGAEREKLAKLEEIIHRRLVNQEDAVRLISQTIRSKSIGVVKSKRPIGSFLFLGPTGVGKTETAKVLAEVYFGATENILRFDMAEYAGEGAVTRLIGDPSRSQPGALTDAIKKNPTSLLLLDELEKAPSEVVNLLLVLLDEGFITDAFGDKVSARNTFIIGTSNAGTELVRQKVGSGQRALQKEVVEYVMRNNLFAPELINRFDGVVVYEPLTKEHLFKVAHLMLSQLAKGISEKGIELVVTDEAALHLSNLGYEPEFGARPMRRLIELEIGDMLGKALLAGHLRGGDKIKLVPRGTAFGHEKV